MTLRLASAVLVLAPACWGQFDLYLVRESIEARAPQVVDFGGRYPGEASTIRFRLRNGSDTIATLSALSVDGVGFSISGASPLPLDLAPQAAMDLGVIFQAVNVGSYSATLRTNGVSTLLTASVFAGLTPELDSSGSIQLLGPIAFDAVELGALATRTVVLENLTAQVVVVPAISVSGTAFTLGTLPSGTLLQPRQSARFDVRFQPPAPGTHVGTLRIGDRSYALSGTSFNPALPKPKVVLSPGGVSVVFDSPARVAGSGVLNMEFQPLSAGASDPAIAFESGMRTYGFSFAVGDGEVPAAFHSGTTAGTIVFTAVLGGVTARESLAIAAAPVVIISANGSRSGTSLETRVAGVDNTRTAGQLVYVFYDVSGSTVATVTVDAGVDFARYFQSSDAGGNFLLRSVFPVAGDASRIAAYELSLTNSAGTVRTPRISF